MIGGLAGVAYTQVAAAATWGETELILAYAGGALGVAAASAVAFGVLVGMVAAADPAG